jgi:LPXTG-motif cell wall-anchored protein
MRRYLQATMAVATAALAGTVLFTATAAADQRGVPASGDNRATAHDGNVVEKDCPKLFPGSTAITLKDLTYSIDGTNTYIDITAVKNGAEVAGVVVKGGPAYNVYEVADLGNLPWLDLHSPINPSGKPAQISHWFVCGTKGLTTTTTTTTTKTTTTTTGTTETTTTTDATTTTTVGGGSGGATTTTTIAPGGGNAGTTTTSADVAPAASDDDLASTGFNGGWLVALGAVLLLGGGALLIVMRTRGARR